GPAACGRQTRRRGAPRARQRQLLLHPAAELSGETVTEGTQAEQGEVPSAPRLDDGGRHPSQLAHIAEVFVDAQVGVEAECLGEIPHLLASFPGWPAEDFDDAVRGGPDPAEKVERAGVART